LTLGDRVNFLHVTETTCNPTNRLERVKVSQQRDTENYDQYDDDDDDNINEFSPYCFLWN